MDLNRNLTNEELLANAEIKKALDEGNLVLIDKVQTSNEEYVNLYFMAKVTGLPSSNTEVSDLGAQLLGWNSTEVYMRAIQNASAKVAQKLPKGATIPGTIRVKDSLKAWFDGQQPRVDRNGNILLNNGKPIYRTTQICSHDEFQKKGHDTLEVTERVDVKKEAAEAAKQPTPSASLETLISGEA